MFPAILCVYGIHLNSRVLLPCLVCMLMMSVGEIAAVC